MSFCIGLRKVQQQDSLMEARKRIFQPDTESPKTTPSILDQEPTVKNLNPKH